MVEEGVVSFVNEPTAFLDVVSVGFGFSRKLTTFPVSSNSRIPLLMVSGGERERERET